MVVFGLGWKKINQHTYSIRTLRHGDSAPLDAINTAASRGGDEVHSRVWAEYGVAMIRNLLQMIGLFYRLRKLGISVSPRKFVIFPICRRGKNKQMGFCKKLSWPGRSASGNLKMSTKTKLVN